MKKFIFDTVLIVVFSLILGELVSRCLSLKNETFDIRNYNSSPGQSIFYPNKKGYFVFGEPPFLHKTKFGLNDIGFNTTLDFKQFDDDKINVSFIGDSFVEGFHVDTKYNFSSLLMKNSQKIQSYDFGCSNFNAINYHEVYEYYEMYKFDYVFVVLDIRDLTYEKPLRLVERKNINYIYSNIHLLNYLDKTGAILKFLKVGNFVPMKLSKDQILDRRVKELLEKPNLYVITRDSESLDYLRERNFQNIIEIDHVKRPIDFGSSERHYNSIGRENIVNSIFSHIKNNSKKIRK